MKREMRFRCVDVSFVGDGCQVCFDNGEAESESTCTHSLAPYFLVQRHFEFPGGGSCHVETHDIDACGEYHFAFAELLRSRLRLRTSGDPSLSFDVEFEASHRDFGALREALRAMIPQDSARRCPFPAQRST